MHDAKLAFIGGGNMARSLIGGLIGSGTQPADICAADPDPGQRDDLSRRFGITVTGENEAAAAGADVIVLATKPQVLKGAIAALGAPDIRPLYVSVAAGIRVADIRRWLGVDAAIVRAMPNTPALLGCGVTALYANPAVNAEQRELAETLMRAAGAIVWVPDEQQMDAVTALSGSGPAYFFYMIEIMTRTGVELGLAPDAAALLAQETALGAARMAMESEETVDALRARVTSPGGTTAAALAVMESQGVADGIAAGVRAACARSAELAREFGAD